jgi:hypothetical protein
MLSDANREIRHRIELEEGRRQAAARRAMPLAYIDGLVAELEELNLSGIKDIPADFLAALHHLGDLLPPQAGPPVQWPAGVRQALDQCFELQEALRRQRPLRH